jgi:hypothetical protein
LFKEFEMKQKQKKLKGGLDSWRGGVGSLSSEVLVSEKPNLVSEKSGNFIYIWCWQPCIALALMVLVNKFSKWNSWHDYTFIQLKGLIIRISLAMCGSYPASIQMFCDSIWVLVFAQGPEFLLYQYSWIISTWPLQCCSDFQSNQL